MTMAKARARAQGTREGDRFMETCRLTGGEGGRLRTVHDRNVVAFLWRGAWGVFCNLSVRFSAPLALQRRRTQSILCIRLDIHQVKQEAKKVH
jgi:hypothetical protein